MTQEKGKPFQCPHKLCPKGYESKAKLVRHLEEKLHCHRGSCQGCNEAEQLVSNKRQRREKKEQAAAAFVEKRRTKHEKIDAWLARVREKLLAEDGHNLDARTYPTWEDDVAHYVRTVRLQLFNAVQSWTLTHSFPRRQS